MEGKLRNLKLKREGLYAQVDMLSSVNDSLYLQIGKVEVEIRSLERKILQENKNTFDES
jgi:hypothetical protein